MRILRKFKCVICGCEAANYRSGGRYCQKCRLIYEHRMVHKVFEEMANNPKFSISKYFQDTVASMSWFVKQRIAEQLGGFPNTYDEQSKLDAKRVKQAEKDVNNVTSKTKANYRRAGIKMCACCGEKFKAYGNADSKHCAVCRSVFGTESLRAIDKLSDEHKCELYKIHRAESNDEVKSMTPPSLHQNLPPRLNIRLQPAGNVVMVLMRAKLTAQMLENEKHKKRPFMCRRCGYTYLLEGEHPEPFICDRCKTYDEEHRKGTKLRDIPGLPAMTYEHLALLPEYAACMFTKHMTAEEMEKLRMIKAKVNPHRATFSEQIDAM